MVAVALGTDTGGSCRVPAAMCGIVGYKPTQLRVPLAGVYPLSFSLDSIGSLGASVACVGLVDQIMAGEPPSALMPLPLAGRRLAVPSNVALDGLDPDVARAFEAALARLSRLGVVIKSVRMPTLDRVAALFDKGGIAAAEAYALHKPLLASKAAEFDPRVRTRIELGATQSAADYLGLRSLRQELCAAFDAETADFDAVAMPTCPITPPPIAAFAKDEEFLRLNRLLLRNTALANQLDRCSISLPCHEPGEAPVGFMLTGERGADHALLRLAAGVEAALAQQST
jgi:aspartyl-tRNA(Asn)/glutamyl-tRNA(Gln) amidotransferase subunit A